MIDHHQYFVGFTKSWFLLTTFINKNRLENVT